MVSSFMQSAVAVVVLLISASVVKFSHLPTCQSEVVSTAISKATYPHNRRKLPDATTIRADAISRARPKQSAVASGRDRIQHDAEATNVTKPRYDVGRLLLSVSRPCANPGKTLSQTARPSVR